MRAVAVVVDVDTVRPARAALAAVARAVGVGVLVDRAGDARRLDEREVAGGRVLARDERVDVDAQRGLRAA